jgi:Alginate export
MHLWRTLVLLTLPVSLLAARPVGAENLAAPFRLVRSDENYDPQRLAAGVAPAPEPYKYLPLTPDGSTYLSLGGELRERYEALDAPRFGIGAPSDTYDLQRLLLHADLHVGPQLRLYAELGDHRVFGRRTAATPVDESWPNVQNLFLDLSPEAAEHWRLRLGRQELLLNPMQRLVAVREGPNLRQSYDGGRLSWASNDWRADAFSLRPVVVVKPDAFENRADPGTRFSGLYVSHALAAAGSTLDAYYLAYDHANARFGALSAFEHRRTVGSHVTLRQGAWDADADVAWQFGHYGSRRIDAWAFGADGGVTLAQALQPRIGLRADAASGGSASSPTNLGTFNPMFPRGGYFDESSLTTFANLWSLRPNLTLSPSRSLSLQLAEAWRWKQNGADAVYMVPLVPIAATRAVPARYLGRWTILDATWRANRWLSFSAEYMDVAAGPGLTLAGGRDTRFGMLLGQLKF